MGAVADQQRSDIEAGFLSNAFIFFVGWSWVVVLRDATALVFLLSTLLTGGSQLVGVTAEVICGFMLGQPHGCGGALVHDGKAVRGDRAHDEGRSPIAHVAQSQTCCSCCEPNSSEGLLRSSGESDYSIPREYYQGATARVMQLYYCGTRTVQL